MSEHYEPTSHEYLYEIDRAQLFAMFAGAIRELRVDDDGCHCLPAEAQGLSRMARAVQGRTVGGATPRESKLGSLATVTRVLLSRTDSHDRGEEQPEPMADFVAHFVRLRAEVGDVISVASPVIVPDDLSELDEVPDVEEPGEDVPTVEGGYVWHTDGRPPEPVKA